MGHVFHNFHYGVDYSFFFLDRVYVILYPRRGERIMQKELKLAYTAGLFDGEGTVTLSRPHSRDKYRAPTVSMTSTSKELLDFLVQEFGGFIVKQKVYKSHHKQSWSWRLKHRTAINFLLEISPYLREKSKIRRAKLICTTYLEVTPRNGKYSDEMKAKKLLFEEDFFAS